MTDDDIDTSAARLSEMPAWLQTKVEQREHMLKQLPGFDHHNYGELHVKLDFIPIEHTKQQCYLHAHACSACGSVNDEMYEGMLNHLVNGVPVNIYYLVCKDHVFIGPHPVEAAFDE